MSVNINSVFFGGRLTRDPELRAIAGGQSVATLGVVCNRKWKDKSGQLREEATFVDVEVWGGQAEFAAQNLHKGDQVVVEGQLKLDTWEDKATGAKRSKLKINGRSVHAAGGRTTTDAPTAGKHASVVDEPIPF